MYEDVVLKAVGALFLIEAAEASPIIKEIAKLTFLLSIIKAFIGLYLLTL